MQLVSTRRLCLLCLASVALWGCKDPEQANYETPGAPAAPVPAPKQFALDDFKRLAWLEGSWRGQLPDGRYFHETYHVANDSTIAQGGYADSTFATKNDSATIAFRNGVVIDSSAGSPPWHASSLDSSTVDFQKSSDPKNHFTWTRDSRDQWTARLYPSGGNAPAVTYVMKRVRR